MFPLNSQLGFYFSVKVKPWIIISRQIQGRDFGLYQGFEGPSQDPLWPNNWGNFFYYKGQVVMKLMIKALGWGGGLTKLHCKSTSVTPVESQTVWVKEKTNMNEQNKPWRKCSLHILADLSPGDQSFPVVQSFLLMALIHILRLGSALGMR